MVAQTTDLEIAESYVKSGDCDLAIIYYQKIIQFKVVNLKPVSQLIKL